jgi:molecular chaperone GrpE (heat shock protein)
MSSPSVPSLSRSPRIIPFLLADVLLLAMAGFVIDRTASPMELWQAVLCAGCVGLAAWFGCWPFLIDQRAALRLAEQDGLSGTLQQIQQLELIARQIQVATGQWQTVQEHASKVSRSAQEIGDRMTLEAKSFAEFMQRTNDAEKNTLRLEVDKLRRGEAEWLQVVVRIMDHIYALHQAAVRSGQPRLTEQITHFQMACRDVIRRLGLVPFQGVPGDPLDPKVHQPVEEQGPPTGDARIVDTVGCGYTYQGQLLRPVMVTWQPADAAAAGAGGATSTTSTATASPNNPPPEDPGAEEQLGLNPL